MMKKKKKQSRSQSSNTKSHEPSSVSSSPSPRLLSKIFHPKLSGKDLKHMFRGMKGNKTMPGLSSQSRIVRCTKCHKLLQEPLDATSYKCGECYSILHAKRWELEDNDNTNKIPKARLSSQNHSLNPDVESEEGGSRTPMRSSHQEYNSKAPSTSVNKHETSDSHTEWMRMTDEFSMTGDSDVLYASGRSSPYNSRSNASQWTQHEGRYSHPASPSSSSAYEYGYSSPFRGSHVFVFRLIHLMESTITGILSLSCMTFNIIIYMNLVALQPRSTLCSLSVVIRHHIDPHTLSTPQRLLRVTQVVRRCF